MIAELTAVKGIGEWTAHMFLMFTLHRPDVLPVGDLGVRNAAARRPTARTADELVALAERVARRTARGRACTSGARWQHTHT